MTYVIPSLFQWQSLHTPGQSWNAFSPSENILKGIIALSPKRISIKLTLTLGLNAAKYVSPSPVQWQSLPLVNLGMDLVIQAKSGTGKTLVFVVGALNMVKLDSNSVQVIMIAPTREIAVQGARAVLDVAKGAKMDELKVHTFIGK